MTIRQPGSAGTPATYQDFSAAFMAINGILADLRKDPATRMGPVFAVCERMLASPAHRTQKQAYFLYRSVAETLQAIAALSRAGRAGHRQRALDLLLAGIGQSHEGLRRAAAEALGTLPLAIDRRPPPPPPGLEELPAVAPPLCDGDWLAAHEVQPLNGWEWRGRSVLAAAKGGGILVIKCLRKGEDPLTLCREAAWMRHLSRMPDFAERRFEIPRPLTHAGGCLVRRPSAGQRSPDGTMLHPQGYALAFLASRAYFHYPNEADPDRRLDGLRLREVLGRNAWLLGRLLAMGIAHTAPIPLFHNRAQSHRREDGGHYRWTHAGRLDRWLASCRHPNFGVSGLRDFEHFTSLAGRPRSRYEAIGSHLISLLLVAGSHFRCKDPQRKGIDAVGRPVDARDLFERDLLEAVIRDIYEAYYEGFTGQAASADPLVSVALVDRMIDEMGTDRHMEEILRIVDQEAMARPAFEAFLQSRGLPAREAAHMLQGAADIPLMTGPHLGGFNQSISLPELIAFAAGGAARCVAGRFRLEGDRPG